MYNQDIGLPRDDQQRMQQQRPQQQLPDIDGRFPDRDGRPPDRDGRPPDRDGRPGGDRRLINDIIRAIIGEAHAYNYYERLAQLAPNAQYRQIILGIRQDERRHYNQFIMVLRRMGRRPPIIPPGELPTRFREGVRDAIRDEREAADFYQDIAFRADDRRTQRIFLNASGDELRHASLLQFILSGLDRR